MARSIFLSTVLAICLALPSITLAQQGGGDTGGGGGGGETGGNVGGDLGDLGGTGGTTNNPLLSGSVTSGGEFQALDLQNSIMDISLPELEIVNDRLQPFVGPSSENVVHPRSQIAGGNAGGGGTTNPFANLFGNQFGNQAFGTGQQNGFEVVRRGLRSRVVPLILDRSSSDLQASPEFVARVNRISAFGDEAGNINVTVSNYTATLTGTVRTQEQKDLIERMTRLEPGIYRIDNQITVSD